MEIYIIGMTSAIYGFPALLLFLFSYLYYRKGNLKLRAAGIVLFISVAILYSILAFSFSEYATYKRAGILYMFLQLFAFGTLAVNAWLLFPKR